MNIPVHQTELEKWLALLEEEFSIPDDNIDKVKEGIKRAIKDVRSPELPSSATGGIEFRDIIVGKTYKFRSDVDIKSFLKGAHVTVTEKKRTNVTATLVKGVGKYSAGARFNVNPKYLEVV